MKIIELESVLEPSQQYVKDYKDKFESEIYAVKHDKATTTCFEKSDLIGFEPEQVIKTVMLWNNTGKFYAFVGPEIGERARPLKFDNQLLKKMFSYDQKKSKEMMNLTNSIMPIGMDRGTCTFLVPDYYFEGDGYTGSLEKIYFINHPSIDNKIVDISIGGMGDEARKISLQGTYKTFFDIVNWKFPGRVEKINVKTHSLEQKLKTVTYN